MASTCFEKNFPTTLFHHRFTNYREIAEGHAKCTAVRSVEFEWSVSKLRFELFPEIKIDYIAVPHNYPNSRRCEIGPGKIPDPVNESLSLSPNDQSLSVRDRVETCILLLFTREPGFEIALSVAGRELYRRRYNIIYLEGLANDLFFIVALPPKQI